MSLVETIAGDLIEGTPLLMVAERKHAKSTSAKTIIMKALERDPDLVIKVLDVSNSWAWTGPTQYRVFVTREKISRDQVPNLGSCCY